MDGKEVPRDRLDLKEDPELLSPPHLAQPYQCATAVTVYGFVPHATIDVEVAGAVVVVVDEVVVLLVVVVSSTVVEVVLELVVELVEDVAPVVVVGSSCSLRTVPGKEVGSSNGVASSPSVATSMNLRQISAGRLPPVTPFKPRLCATAESASMVGTVLSGSGSA